MVHLCTFCAHKLCIHSFDIMQLVFIVKHAKEHIVSLPSCFPMVSDEPDSLAPRKWFAMHFILSGEFYLQFIPIEWKIDVNLSIVFLWSFYSERLYFSTYNKLYYYIAIYLFSFAIIFIINKHPSKYSLYIYYEFQFTTKYSVKIN